MQVKVRRRAILVVVALLCTCISQASAQTTPDELEKLLKGKRLALRNFSADQTVKAKWANDALTFDPPTLSAFGVFTPGSVKLKGTTLAIQGTRSIVLVDGKSGKPGISEGSPAWLEIDLGASDPATTLPKLESALFFPDLDSAASAIPPQMRPLVPMAVPLDRMSLTQLTNLFGSSREATGAASLVILQGSSK